MTKYKEVEKGQELLLPVVLSVQIVDPINGIKEGINNPNFSRD